MNVQDDKGHSYLARTNGLRERTRVEGNSHAPSVLVFSSGTTGAPKGMNLTTTFHIIDI